MSCSPRHLRVRWRNPLPPAYNAHSSLSCAGILWGVLEQYPFDLAYHRGHEIAKAGTLGELRSYSLEFYGFVEAGSKYHATSWREKPQYQGGFLLDGGVHFFAGLRHLLAGANLELSQVGAQADLIHDHLAPHDTIQGFLQAVKIGSGASAPASEEGPALAGNFAISFAQEVSTARSLSPLVTPHHPPLTTPSRPLPAVYHLAQVRPARLQGDPHDRLLVPQARPDGQGQGRQGPRGAGVRRDRGRGGVQGVGGRARRRRGQS